MAETPVFRLRQEHLDLRFKRAMVRGDVHNWFVLTFSAAQGGGTNIVANEHLGMGRGWWMPGVFGGAFTGTIMALAGKFRPGGIVFVAIGMQAISLAVSAIFSAFLARSDRERLDSLIARVADAGKRPNTRLQSDGASRRR